MRNGWLYSSLIIALAASLVAFTILALMSSIASGQGQLLDIISANGILGSVTYDLFTLTNAPFFLALIAILLLELLCGALSVLSAMSADDKSLKWLMPSFIAGILPALALGVFMFNSWRNSVLRIEAHANVRPAEPAPLFVVIGSIAFLMAVCLLVSFAGSLLAQVALKSGSKREIQ